MGNLVDDVVGGKQIEGAELWTIPLSRLLANPFRSLNRYPIRRDKVETLRESIRATGFWPNVVGRPGKKRGTVEIAYGHHRRAAALEELGPDAKVNVLVTDLTDGAMLQIMARENMHEWESNAVVDMETVRAIVEAYADGKIKLDPGDTRRGHRYAPAFSIGNSSSRERDKPYTTESVAAFMGSDAAKVANTLQALVLVDMGVLEESIFADLKPKQAEVVVIEALATLKNREIEAKHAELEAAAAHARAARAETEKDRVHATRTAEEHETRAKAKRAEIREAPRRVAKGLADQLRVGKIGTREAKREARRIDPVRNETPPPHIDSAAKALASVIERLLSRDDLATRLSEFVRWRTHMRGSRLELAHSLRLCAARCIKWADDLESPEMQDVTKRPAQLGR